MENIRRNQCSHHWEQFSKGKKKKPLIPQITPTRRWLSLVTFLWEVLSLLKNIIRGGPTWEHTFFWQMTSVWHAVGKERKINCGGKELKQHQSCACRLPLFPATAVFITHHQASGQGLAKQDCQPGTVLRIPIPSFYHSRQEGQEVVNALYPGLTIGPQATVPSSPVLCVLT